MSRLEESAVRRHAGSRILLFGIAIAAIGVLPLLLYVAFGPEDGNPIGLGLLAVAAVPIGLMIAVVGLIKVLVELWTRRSS